MADRLAEIVVPFEMVFSVISALLALLAAVIGFYFGASGVRKWKSGLGKADLKAEIENIKSSKSPSKPFETIALAEYYNQVLSRANVSFWFSLGFASIGFGVIIFAFLTYNPSDVTVTVIRVLSGVVIDAVASLFFVQSTNAQKSMAEFFEKLRLDRQNAEARELIAEIEDHQSRDQLRIQLILKYSGIESLPNAVKSEHE